VPYPRVYSNHRRTGGLGRMPLMAVPEVSTPLRAAWIASILVLIAGVDSRAQAVSYDISFPNRVHHEAEISATFTGVRPNAPLEVRMSRTSPGRYALHEFAKNVYNVKVDDGAGNALPFTRPDLHQWTVTGHAGTVRVSYTLFADHADGTYSGINNRYVHLNIPATFVWARETQGLPVTLRIDSPESEWNVATQLFPTDDPWVFTAPNFWYFIDSPIHAGRIWWDSWTVTESDRSYSIRLALNHDGTDEQAAGFARMVEAVTREQIGMWRDVPDFETGTYTFIAAYLPSVDGDGMEHRNSTVLTYPPGLAEGTISTSDAWLDPLGTVSHEFFHAWNVERLRPNSLEPFDFEKANVSGELWFAEGFTSYYDGLFLRRAGLINDAEYAANLTRTVDTAVNSPGRHFFSPVEMSMQAPFVDAATAVDPNNRRNTFISYYTGGDALALGLDLELRSRHASSLDEYMRALWQRYGRSERPYTLEDLETVLGDVTGDEKFAGNYFSRHVRGTEVMDYERLLGLAGFAVVAARPGSVWLGSELSDEASGGAVLVEEPLLGSPLYEAGLERGSVIVGVDGRGVPDASYLRGAMDEWVSGDVVEVTYIQNGEALTSHLTVTSDPSLRVTTYEEIGLPVSSAARTFRSEWLGSSLQSDAAGD
ncbi:MAG: PDZ domain-containing protein, partial [Rhodothermia bacterium]|nr:PDZ domain-containing protein [Rhodothermia bacterium]